MFAAKLFIYLATHNGFVFLDQSCQDGAKAVKAILCISVDKLADDRFTSKTQEATAIAPGNVYSLRGRNP